MDITLNGEHRHLPDNFTAAQLVDLLDLTGKRMAMEINCEIVPRSTFSEHVIKDGDSIEIVGAIGGG
jgi:sulfur carrier protein